MNQTPFLALSRGEQHALLGALRQAGVALRSMCVSRHELPGRASGSSVAWITLTGTDWCRSYALQPGWEGDLALDLRLNAPGPAPGAGA
jgi:hypothetical protein